MPDCSQPRTHRRRKPRSRSKARSWFPSQFRRSHLAWRLPPWVTKPERRSLHCIMHRVPSPLDDQLVHRAMRTGHTRDARTSRLPPQRRWLSDSTAFDNGIRNLSKCPGIGAISGSSKRHAANTIAGVRWAKQDLHQLSTDVPHSQHVPAGSRTTPLDVVLNGDTGNRVA